MKPLFWHPITAPLTITAISAMAVVLLWQSLRADQESKVAQVTEAASYATRSELARQLILQFRALRELADFWADSRRGQQALDSTVPLRLFEGVDLIVWDETGGSRFLNSGSEFAFDREASEGELARLTNLLPENPPTQSRVAGPVFDDEGHAIFTFAMPVYRTGQLATLVGLIDARDALETFLLDEAPGYDIRVRCCGNIELYRRGGSTADFPETWIRSGWIEPEPGMRWNVEHRPSTDLVADLTTWAANAVLLVGLAMSLALGALVYQSRRATDRAAAATEAEHSVRLLNRSLEDQVALRTQDLNEVLADLNTINLSVSHDLRSPLNAISMLAHRLRLQEEQSADSAERFERISANIKRMGDILDRLFGFSRASSFEYSIGDVDMRALSERVAEEQIKSSNLQTQIDIGDLPHADADETMIHILLSNLVENALKHAKGSRIEIGHEERDGRSVYYVRDSGPGFDASLEEEVFKPMKRLTEGKGAGLGLGLTIAARIAKRHGGRIWVESETGKGATFYFTLGEEHRPEST